MGNIEFKCYRHTKTKVSVSVSGSSVYVYYCEDCRREQFNHGRQRTLDAITQNLNKVTDFVRKKTEKEGG